MATIISVAPPLPVIKSPAQILNGGIPNVEKKATTASGSGFDWGGILTGLLGLGGKIIDSKTAQANAGTVVYSTAPTTTAGGTGFDFSSPLFLVVVAVAFYLITRK